MPADTKPRQPSKYWMRSVSFAGLHRLLHVVAEYPEGLRPRDMNKIVLDESIPLMRNRQNPSATTLYHYRNTLVHLGALIRDGSKLRPNLDNVHVRELLRGPMPDHDVKYLTRSAQDHFGNLVLRNEQCRALFFDIFMPQGVGNYGISDFRRSGYTVKWERPDSGQVVLHNPQTGRAVHCKTSTSINAVLYGLRYWARDELNLIDEYCLRTNEGVVMFPLSCSMSSYKEDIESMRIVQILLSQKSSDDWTLFSIFDLIESICKHQRISIGALFCAIDWLVDKWSGHIMLIPTSRGLATITAGSSQREEMELRQYYRRKDGPYISHIRVHKDVRVEPIEKELFPCPQTIKN